MLSTAEEVTTFVINVDLYFFEFLRYGLVSFKDFLDIFNYTTSSKLKAQGLEQKTVSTQKKVSSRK
jgi:hypothetical protein